MPHIPWLDIDRSIKQYANAAQLRLIRALINLARETDTHLSNGEAAAALSEIGIRITEGHLNQQLHEIKRKSHAAVSTPALAVKIEFPAGWRPRLKWFGGEFPWQSNELSQFGEQEGGEYRAGGHDALWRVLCTYCALTEAKIEPSLRLIIVDSFCRALVTGPGEAPRFRTRHDQEIVDFMRSGFPHHPVHMDGLVSHSPIHILSVRHFARLLHGIRTSETDLPAAEDFLTKVELGTVEEICPLRHLAVGVCRRKIDGEEKLRLALSILNRGIENLEHSGSQGESCGYCDVGCSRQTLLVEHHRCMGAAERKLAWFNPSGNHLQHAKTHFAAGEKHLTDRIQAVVKADFYYSYGYLIFESALRVAKLRVDGNSADLRLELLEAKAKFDQSIRFRPTWAAPYLRRGIIKLTLQEEDWGRQDFSNAEEYAGREDSTDAQLTGVLAAICRLSVILDCTDYDCRAVFEQLLALFRGDTLLPRGPRECHGFDAAAALAAVNELPAVSHNQSTDKAFRLLIAAQDWGRVLSAEEQREHVDAWLGAHG